MKKAFLIAVALIAAAISLSARPDPIDVEFGPWVTNVSSNSITVIWTTKTPNLGWVEITEDDSRAWNRRDLRKVYPLFAGRRMFGRFHSVTIGGLTPGTLYYYRVSGQKVVDDSLEQDMVYGIEKRTDVFTVRTFDPAKGDCHFSMVNDIHMEVDLLSALSLQVDRNTSDFFFLNGDITTAGNYTVDTLARYDIAPLGKLLKKVPVMFGRGNHEGRGNNWMASYQIFPTCTPGQFYYTFRQGPVSFIVLDTGETKPMVSASYVGDTFYGEYLEEELEWAREALKDPEFASAPFKVCLMHVPVLPKSGTDMTPEEWMYEHFVPVLNEAGIDLMINGHKHKFSVHPIGESGSAFPLYVNGKGERLQFDCDGSTIVLQGYDRNGNPLPDHRLVVDRKPGKD